MDILSIPLIDNHAHALSRRQPRTVEEFRAHFSESPAPEMARDHVGTAVQYRWAIKQIAGALDCAAREDAILERRGSVLLAEYARALLAGSNVAALLLDEGYPPPDEAYTSAQMGTMLGVTIGRMLRIETFVADLIVRHARFADVVAAFDRELADIRGRGYVSLKSIAAYRTGLMIEPVTGDDAERAFSGIQPDAGQRGSLRLSSKPLIDFFVWRGLTAAARQGVPVQFHTGYGDPDLDLRLANPLHLRPLFEERQFAAAPIVLLHESYPYTAEAAYLAAAYPNAYMDLAFALPPLDATVLRWGVETALGVAPASKIMVSSDGTRIPEQYYLGAVRCRSILSRVLAGMVQDGELTEVEAGEMAALLMHDNAVRVYRLPMAPVLAANRSDQPR